jgi:hypothetical protein
MEFRYEPHKDHLLVVATGHFDADACRAALGEILRICAEHRLDRILLDAHAIAEVVSIADRFDLARLVAMKRAPRIAILVTRANAAHSRAFEDTAINRGAVVKTTASDEEARRFLGLD